MSDHGGVRGGDDDGEGGVVAACLRHVVGEAEDEPEVAVEAVDDGLRAHGDALLEGGVEELVLVGA